MGDHFKRPNKLTGMPYEPGFKDEDGKYFIKYLNKQGNDGYYYEEWAKNKEAYLKKFLKATPTNDINDNHNLNFQLHQ